MAILMVAWSGQWKHHASQFVHDPPRVLASAGRRDVVSTSRRTQAADAVTPLRIPMTVAALGYFAVQGMYF